MSKTKRITKANSDCSNKCIWPFCRLPFVARLLGRRKDGYGNCTTSQTEE